MRKRAHRQVNTIVLVSIPVFMALAFAQIAQSALAQSAGLAPSQISNPSFEEVEPSQPTRPRDWYAPGGPLNIYASGGSHTGDRHVESALYGETTAQGCTMYNANWISLSDVEIDPNVSYTLSFWTKSVLYTSTSHNMPFAGFEFFDAQHALVGTGATERGTMDLQEWTNLAYIVGPGGVQIPESASYMRVYVGGAGWEYGEPCEPDRVYAVQAFDDISFVPSDFSAPNTGHGGQGSSSFLMLLGDLVGPLALVGVVVTLLGLYLRRRRAGS